MSSKLALIAFLLVPACATTQRFTSPSEPHIGAHLEIRPHAALDDTHVVVPRLVGDAMLPTADRMATALRADRDRYELGLRVCVSPSGAVTHADLTRSSGVAQFDDAAVRDVQAWRYERLPGPASVQTCTPIEIRYLP